MQNDGNLVLQDNLKTAKWASGTSSSIAANLTLQNDGNLVIYDKLQKPLWDSNTLTSC